MAFTALIGKVVGFCGVDNNVMCLSVRGGRLAFEAVEDESDDYRSMMEEVRDVPVAGHVFHARPIARLRVEDDDAGDFSGYRLVDSVTGHVWLRFGTDHVDDYYPTFLFQYDPPR